MKEMPVPCSDPSVYEMIRTHFAREEKLDPKMAKLRYSDRKLQIAEEVDPTLFKHWANTAATRLEQTL
ncbi:MAG: hypothetical protein AAB618_01755 [Patescibacteria group bacterium]